MCVSHLPLPFSRRGLGASHVQLFITSCTVAYQALLSVDFSRQEHWSRLAFPSPGLPNPGVRRLSPTPPALAGRFFTTAPPGEPAHTLNQDDLLWRSSSVLYLPRSASQIRSHSQVPGVETLTFLSGACLSRDSPKGSFCPSSAPRASSRMPVECSLQRSLWSGPSVRALPHGEDAEPEFLWGTRPRLPKVSRTHVMASGPAFPL